MQNRLIIICKPKDLKKELQLAAQIGSTRVIEPIESVDFSKN